MPLIKSRTNVLMVSSLMIKPVTLGGVVKRGKSAPVGWCGSLPVRVDGHPAPFSPRVDGACPIHPQP